MADLPIFGKMSFLSVSYSVKKKKKLILLNGQRLFTSESFRKNGRLLNMVFRFSDFEESHHIQLQIEVINMTTNQSFTNSLSN